MSVDMRDVEGGGDWRDEQTTRYLNGLARAGRPIRGASVGRCPHSKLASVPSCIGLMSKGPGSGPAPPQMSLALPDRAWGTGSHRLPLPLRIPFATVRSTLETFRYNTCNIPRIKEDR
jgi:hypothetical protein